MKIVITDHAADRFCFRIDRTKTNHEAIAILTDAMPTATALPKRSIRGDEPYQIDSPPCLLVCKRENDEPTHAREGTIFAKIEDYFGTEIVDMPEYIFQL